MKCKKCGAALADNQKFCPSCGTKAPAGSRNTQMKERSAAARDSRKDSDDRSALKGMMKLECKGCGAILEPTPGSNVVECPFCGTKELIVEDRDVAIERIRSSTYRDIEIERMRIEQEEEERKAEAEERKAFRKLGRPIRMIIGMMFYGICAAAAFGDDRTLSGFTGIAQIALLGLSWLMGMGIIKTRKAGTYRVPRILALLLIFVYLMGFSSSSRSYTVSEEPFVWSDLVMGDQLPAYDSETARISSNSDRYLSVTFEDQKATVFYEYKAACKDAGFTIDVNDSGTMYTAYNSEGYDLELFYSEYDSSVSIYLNAPLQMKELTWPTVTFGSLAPAPKSLYGTISSNSSNYFAAYIGNSTEEDVTNYIQEVKAAGFTENSYEYADSYRGENADGIEIYVNYEGNSTMFISLSNY
ncbi:MAG: zinc ribbon domain-containing protein [Lachnospiraceae bacterium]|nr:zinc ribbon domain-containing protein [Lachnospiraceae bacterium]